MSFICARTALTTSTVLAPDCFCTNKASPLPTWLKAEASFSLYVSLTVATSLRRTTLPLTALITVFSNSATLSYLPGIRTAKSYALSVTKPAGTLMLFAFSIKDSCATDTPYPCIRVGSISIRISRSGCPK